MNTFEKNILSLYGEKGKAWIKELPLLTRHYETLWELKELKPLEGLSYNYVLGGYQKDKPIVLKISLDFGSLDREASALEVLHEHGTVSLYNRDKGALLLQRAIPGISLKEHPLKEQSISIACQVMESMHQASLSKNDRFPHMENWLSALDKEWAIPKKHLEKARKLKNELLQIPMPQVLLHGDLHRENILSNGQNWLAIDPKGVIGNPIHETWAFVEDPEFDLKFISRYFNFQLNELTKWYYVHLVLAACWQIEDGLDPQPFLDKVHSASLLL